MTGRRQSDIDLNVRRLTRAHVEAVCDEFGPDHAWVRLGISRSTLYKWRRDWKAEDEAKGTTKETGEAEIVGE